MEASLAPVPCVPEMDVVTVRLLRVSRSEPIDWSSDGSPAADAGCAVWEQLESVWDSKWHGETPPYLNVPLSSCMSRTKMTGSQTKRSGDHPRSILRVFSIVACLPGKPLSFLLTLHIVIVHSCFGGFGSGRWPETRNEAQGLRMDK